MEEFITATCPFCAQPISVEIDVTGGNDQVFVSDCEVCCRPVQFHLSCDESGEWSCSVSGES